MQYHCLVYFDPQKVFNDSPEANAVLDAVGPHAAELKASGHLIMAQPLNLPREAITVRVQRRLSTRLGFDTPAHRTSVPASAYPSIYQRDHVNSE